jgi:hypothetical protein
MTWSIDEVEFDSFPLHAYRSELDGDATLTLEVHIVEGLRLYFAFLECSCDFHESVGKGRLPVVDMRDDAKISDGVWF